MMIRNLARWRKQFERLASKEESKLICEKCKFDCSKEPEIGMGIVRCPSCGAVIDQTGKEQKAAGAEEPETNEYDNIIMKLKGLPTESKQADRNREIPIDRHGPPYYTEPVETGKGKSWEDRPTEVGTDFEPGQFRTQLDEKGIYNVMTADESSDKIQKLIEWASDKYIQANGSYIFNYQDISNYAKEIGLTERELREAIEDLKVLEGIKQGSIKQASIWDYPKDVLCKDVWKDNKLKSEVKDQILDNLFLVLGKGDLKNFPNWIKSVRLLGSLTGYKYNRGSDLDVHIDVDLNNMLEAEERFKTKEEAFEYLTEIRKKLNEKNILIEGTQHPLEFTFEAEGFLSSTSTGGSYNVLEDKWIQEPVLFGEEDIRKVLPDIMTSIQSILTQLDVSLGEVRRDVIDADYLKEMFEGVTNKKKEKEFKDLLNAKLEEIENEIEGLAKTKKDILEKRKENYSEQSEANVIFKAVQRYGYFYIIKQLEKFIEDGKITQEEVPEIKEVVSNKFKKDQRLTLKSGNYDNAVELYHEKKWVRDGSWKTPYPVTGFVFDENFKVLRLGVDGYIFFNEGDVLGVKKAKLDYTKEMEDWFEERTKRHIALVQKYCKKIFDLDPVKYKDLIERGKEHDQSKFESLEREPYIFVGWDYKCKDDGIKFDVPKDIKEKMSKATEHHVKTNEHHPEFWDPNKDKRETINREDRDKKPKEIVDATKMDDISIAEMVADWCGMSEEKGNTPKEWANKNIEVRWNFTPSQRILIYRLINRAWEDPINKKESSLSKCAVDIGDKISYVSFYDDKLYEGTIIGEKTDRFIIDTLEGTKEILKEQIFEKRSSIDVSQYQDEIKERAKRIKLWYDNLVNKDERAYANEQFRNQLVEHAKLIQKWKGSTPNPENTKLLMSELSKEYKKLTASTIRIKFEKDGKLVRM